MTASQIGYGRMHDWVKAYLGGAHATVVRTVAWAVLCVVAAQRVTPAALARALPGELPGSGRSRLRRVGRWWRGPALPRDALTPRLIGAALGLLAPEDAVVVALDTTRVGGWEVWQAGIVWARHTLPIAWAVLPYPWPRGRFRPTTLDLVARVQAGFAPCQLWVLVADRGFPSAALFAQLRAGGTRWTVRLRLTDRVEVAGVKATIVDHLEAGRLRPGERTPVRLGNGAAACPLVEAAVVVSDQVPAPPRHKRNPGTRREQAARAAKRARHLAQKGRACAPPSERARRYAQTWVLCTTAPSAEEAVAQYAARMSVEQTFRDWHHGWGVRDAAAALPQAQAVERLVGIVCLAYLLQLELGSRFAADGGGQARRAQWTVTDRVSPFWCTQHLLHDPGADWSPWLAQQWDGLARPPARPLAREAA